MDFESSAIELLLPVLESSTVLAAHYAKACGRDMVVAKDMKLGMMFAARNVLGKQVGTLYPEIYEEDEEDEEDEEEEEVEDEEWTRYEGTDDDTAIKMNECEATWNEWVPQSPAERMLKKAIENESGSDI
jgi:hypothetical protein